MEALSKEQAESIREYVVASRVTIPSLRDDLVDHLCCEVENKISTGKSFQDSVAEAISQYKPEDLYEIGQQTEFLLHPNKVIMKKLTYFIGLAATISMSMGLMLKILHMPGGEQLVNYGFFAFAGLFMPAIILAKLTQPSQLNAIEKLKLTFGILSAVGLVLTLITKMNQQFDTATIIFFCTSTLFSFGFLPLHFYEMYRKSLTTAN